MNDQTEEDKLVATPVHRSLMRPDLVFGCERGPVAFMGAVAFIMIAIQQKPITIAIGIALLVLGLPALRAMAKRDPYMSRVYLRAVNQQRSYPAHEHLNAIAAEYPAQQGQ